MEQQGNLISVDLPSRNLVYSVEAGSIKIRTLRGKDEKLISEITLDNFEKKFLTVFQNIVTGIDPTELTVGDRLFILVWEAINSYNKEYPIQYLCSSCLNNVRAIVDLSKLELVQLPEEFKEPYPMKLSNNETVMLRLLRVKDEIAIADYERSNKESWLFKYAMTIVDEQKNIIEKMKYLEDLPAGDLARIRSFEQEYAHGPKMEQTCTCPRCGAKEDVACPFRLEMLFPYGKELKRYFRN